MSAWNHSICDLCWKARCAHLGQHGRTPIRVLAADDNGEPIHGKHTAGVCCFCDVQHESGIYVREDPALLNCAHDREA